MSGGMIMRKKSAGDSIKYSTHREVILWSGDKFTGTHFAPEEGQKYIIEHYLEGSPEIIAAWYTPCSDLEGLTKFREIDVSVINNEVVFFVKAYPSTEAKVRLRIHILYK